MTYVFLRSTEPFVILSQGPQYLEGYLAKKPRIKFEQLETDLQQIQTTLKHPKTVGVGLLVAVPWDRRFTRGMVLKAAGDFVTVFLLDYGLRECYSKSSLYLLPEKFQEIPGYGVRIELDGPLEKNLRDTAVMITSIIRRNATTATGTVADTGSGVNLEWDENEEFDENGKPLPKKDSTANGTWDVKETSCLSRKPVPDSKLNSILKVHNNFNNGQHLSNGVSIHLRSHSKPVIPAKKCVPISTKAVSITPKITKPPNDLLLPMIATRCFLTRLLVMQVVSPVEMLCSHYPSLISVRRALDNMNELPPKVPHERVKPNMLVLVFCKATLHRGIVGAIFTDPAISYRVEFIDIPGFADVPMLYRTPSTVANCAPRSLMRVRLTKAVQDVESGDVVTLLCEQVIDNTAYGDLIQNNDQSTKFKSTKSKL